MKKPPLAVELALALAPFPASASPDPALQPLAFLAGHCWIGTIPGTADTDEHCFTWVYEGRYLRDRHVVRQGEKAVYEGDSLDFPAAVLISGGKSFGFRGRWKRSGDEGYEVLREYETEKGWVPVRVPMKKLARAP